MKTVMYLGERVTMMGSIYKLFVDKKGETYHYSKIKHVWLGSCYEITNDGKMKRNPESVEGWEITEKERVEAEAQKLVVTAHRMTKRKAMQLKKPHPDIVKAMNLLGRFYRSMSKWDRQRFVDYLENEMSKGGKR